MKNILITGGAGMIGFELAKQLSRKNKVVVFDLPEKIKKIKTIKKNKNILFFPGSILEKSAIYNACNNIETVFHLGAMLGVQNTENDKLKCIEVNVEGTKNVLDASIITKVKKIIFASSSEVYGEPKENPITEKTTTQGKTVYGISKLLGEELCKAYHQKFGINYTILRYFNCYGPRQEKQFVITNFINNVKNNKSPKINGSGKQIRSYTYVSDTARATAGCLDNPKTNNMTLNIGNGKEPINLIDLATLIIKSINKDKILRPTIIKNFKGTDRKKNREIYFRYCDSSLAQRILKWKPKIKINEGIKMIINEK